MFTTSGDILNLSIAIAVIAVATFLCWTLYYLISNLRRINKISRQVENIVNKTNGLVDLIKSKVKQSGSYIFLFGKLIDRAMDYFNNKKSNREEKEEKNSTKKRK